MLNEIANEYIPGNTSVTNETKYGNIPVPNLSDSQLVEELESVYFSLGKKFDKAQFLMAIMPEPAYVLTSSYTTFSGIYSVNMTTYTMPSGYRMQGAGMFSGTGITQYSYTDANATIRGLIIISQLINQSKIQRLQDRGRSVVAEFHRRVDDKRKMAEKAIDQFFTSNPDLIEKKTIIAAILPWVASEKTVRSDIEKLETAGNIAKGLRTSEKLLNIWFGTFSQIDHFSDGTTEAWSNFIMANTKIVGDVLTGDATTGMGEVVSLQANIKEGKWKGVVTNKTAGVSFECEGIITDTELSGSYKGFAWGRNLEGTVVLLR